MVHLSTEMSIKKIRLKLHLGFSVILILTVLSVLIYGKNENEGEDTIFSALNHHRVANTTGNEHEQNNSEKALSFLLTRTARSSTFYKGHHCPASRDGKCLDGRPANPCCGLGQCNSHCWDCKLPDNLPKKNQTEENVCRDALPGTSVVRLFEYPHFGESMEELHIPDGTCRNLEHLNNNVGSLVLVRGECVRIHSGLDCTSTEVCLCSKHDQDPKRGKHFKITNLSHLKTGNINWSMKIRSVSANTSSCSWNVPAKHRNPHPSFTLRKDNGDVLRFKQEGKTRFCFRTLDSSWRGQVSSVDSHGTCVRIWSKPGCRGRFSDIVPNPTLDVKNQSTSVSRSKVSDTGFECESGSNLFFCGWDSDNDHHLTLSEDGRNRQETDARWGVQSISDCFQEPEIEHLGTFGNIDLRRLSNLEGKTNCVQIYLTTVLKVLTGNQDPSAVTARIQEAMDNIWKNCTVTRDPQPLVKDLKIIPELINNWFFLIHDFHLKQQQDLERSLQSLINSVFRHASSLEVKPQEVKRVKPEKPGDSPKRDERLLSLIEPMTAIVENMKCRYCSLTVLEAIHEHLKTQGQLGNPELFFIAFALNTVENGPYLDNDDKNRILSLKNRLPSGMVRIVWDKVASIEPRSPESAGYTLYGSNPGNIYTYPDKNYKGGLNQRWEVKYEKRGQGLIAWRFTNQQNYNVMYADGEGHAYGEYVTDNDRQFWQLLPIENGNWFVFKNVGNSHILEDTWLVTQYASRLCCRSTVKTNPKYENKIEQHWKIQ